ncbi:MAG: hypothetical protein ACFB9N_05040 [Geitlerinemataceae cyanobacterium]
MTQTASAVLALDFASEIERVCDGYRQTLDRLGVAHSELQALSAKAGRHQADLDLALTHFEHLLNDAPQLRADVRVQEAFQGVRAVTETRLNPRTERAIAAGS